eukprot:1684620-Pyramimonas_sp.AAC.1
MDWASFDKTTPNPDAPVGAPQHHLNTREVAWHAIWEPMQEHPDDPCRALDFPPLPPDCLASLPRPSLDKCRHMCRRYKARTSVGLDSMHPRHHAQLSDSSLLALF